MSETTQNERDLLRLGWDRSGPLCRAMNDADRLAKLEDGIRALADEMDYSDDRPEVVVKCRYVVNRLRNLLDWE